VIKHVIFVAVLAVTCLTDDERKALSEKVKGFNRRSEQGRGGGER
jgi:hypothetical protein